MARVAVSSDETFAVITGGNSSSSQVSCYFDETFIFTEQDGFRALKVSNMEYLECCDLAIFPI